jgi:short-subunit dehydrogenase
VSWRSVVVTGASRGIGAALVLALARPGCTLLLIGRSGAALDGVAAEARLRGADVETAVLDVTDAPAMAARLQRFDARTPVDLVIANAGISNGLSPGRGPEAPGAAAAVIATNLTGALNTVEPLLPGFLARGKGQIVLMSSLAALRPLPDMPAYSASKAGLRAYAIALRGWLRPHRICVTVVCPGFVTTAMSARHEGPRPFEIPPGRAARIILRGLARRRASVTFPRILVLMIRLGNLLPARLSDWTVAGFAAEIHPATPAPAPPLSAGPPSRSAPPCARRSGRTAVAPAAPAPPGG